MPLFNKRGQILAGVAGNQSSLDGVLLPVQGNAAFKDDDTIIGVSLDFSKVISFPISNPANQSDVLLHGANNIFGNNGKWAVFYQGENVPSLVEGSLGTLSGAYIYGIGSDGTIAWKRTYQSPSGLTLTAPDGSVVDLPNANPIDLQVLGPGQVLWQEFNAGLYAYGVTVPKTAITPFVTRVVTLGTDRWVIYGTHTGGLIAQKDGAADGYILVPIGSVAYNHDVVVVDSAIHITWSLTKGEAPSDVRSITLDLTQPTIQLTTPPIPIPNGIQAHPRKLWLAPYFSFSIRYGDDAVSDFETFANAAVAEGDDVNTPSDLLRIFNDGLPMIVGQEYGAQAIPYIGNVIAWLASGADFSSLTTAILNALKLPEKPIIAYLDSPDQWPTSKPSFITTDKIWPAIQAYRRAGESINDFTVRMKGYLDRVTSYGNAIILTPRFDDVNGSQSVQFTLDCMPIYTAIIQAYLICGVMHFSDRRGTGIAKSAELKQWAQLFSLANVARPNRFDYWTSQQSSTSASIKNKLLQTTEVVNLSSTERSLILSKI